MKLSEIIPSIEAEIKAEYLNNAINWCDKHFNNAWSNAIDRFDRSLNLAIDKRDEELANREGELYKKTILALLQKYKKHKNKDDLQMFLEGIGGGR